jgi:hypothetical protein
MTFPWVFETIARSRQDEIRSAVARHHYAQDHCEWRVNPVPRRGALRLFRSHVFGPRAALRLVPSAPQSSQAARSGN